MSRHDPALVKSFETNRAAIDAAREEQPRTCACDACVQQRWDDARDDEFDARWNARIER